MSAQITNGNNFAISNDREKQSKHNYRKKFKVFFPVFYKCDYAWSDGHNRNGLSYTSWRMVIVADF